MDATETSMISRTRFEGSHAVALRTIPEQAPVRPDEIQSLGAIRFIDSLEGRPALFVLHEKREVRYAQWSEVAEFAIAIAQSEELKGRSCVVLGNGSARGLGVGTDLTLVTGDRCQVVAVPASWGVVNERIEEPTLVLPYSLAAPLVGPFWHDHVDFAVIGISIEEQGQLCRTSAKHYRCELWSFARIMGSDSMDELARLSKWLYWVGVSASVAAVVSLMLGQLPLISREVGLLLSFGFTRTMVAARLLSEAIQQLWISCVPPMALTAVTAWCVLDRPFIEGLLSGVAVTLYAAISNLVAHLLLSFMVVRRSVASLTKVIA